MHVHDFWRDSKKEKDKRERGLASVSRAYWNKKQITTFGMIIRKRKRERGLASVSRPYWNKKQMT